MARKSSRPHVLFTLFTLFGLILAPSFASAHEVETGIIATGTGEVRVRPDSVRLTVGVEAQAKTVEEVQRQANDEMQRVLASLRALRIPNLQMQTSIVSVEPVHPTTPEGLRTAEIVGYRASNSVSVAVRKASLDRIAGYASAILTTALHAGANVTGGLTLFLDDPSAAQAQALEEAVKDAILNGEIMAKAAGLTVTGVASMTEGGASFPVMEQAPAFGGEGSRGAPVEAGELVVSSNVTVRLTFR